MTKGPLRDRRLPLVCLVTARWRWHAAPHVAPSGHLEPGDLENLTDRARAACRAGVDVMQIREPDLPAGPLFEAVCACVEISRGSDTLIMVNDRLDVAVAAGADGVHLRANSFPVHAARQIVPRDFLVGRSVHSAADVVTDEAVGADYLVAGSVFPSRSKPAGHDQLGLQGLIDVVDRASAPVFGIGGVSLSNLALLAGSGAAGFAGIDLFSVPTPSDSLSELVRDARSAFSSEVSRA